MKTYNQDRTKVSDLKIAYIGGGSCGWAYVLMNDLSKEPNLSGTVDLYDINYEYAKINLHIIVFCRCYIFECRFYNVFVSF